MPTSLLEVGLLEQMEGSDDLVLYLSKRANAVLNLSIGVMGVDGTHARAPHVLVQMEDRLPAFELLMKIQLISLRELPIILLILYKRGAYGGRR